MARRTLLLNASYEPLATVARRRAVMLVLADKAVLLKAGDGASRSEHLVLPAPSVVRYVAVPYRRVVPSRGAILARDRHVCGYCGGSADTIDHVVPRSRGGAASWTNLVAACRGCNGTKDDQLLGELGWRLRHRPCRPADLAGVILCEPEALDPRWTPYVVAVV